MLFDLGLHTATLSSEMSVAIYAISLFIGLFVYLKTNISPAGFVVPGSIVVAALEGPGSLITIALTAMATYASMKLIEKFTVLYGKRLFANTLAVSTGIGGTAFMLLHRDYPDFFPGDALGFLVPGLIVYQLLRQSPKKTFAVSAAVTAATGAIAVICLAV
jgi:hypothetical protein